MNKKLNQNFIEELEKNSKIFDDKINKLNSGYEEKSQKNIETKYKFTKKKNLYQKEYYNTENNYEENPFKKNSNKYKNKKTKLLNKRYDLDLNDLNNFDEINNDKEENMIYNNTISNNRNQRRYNNKNDLNDEYILDNNPDKQLIEELRQTINQKTNFIKLLKSEIETKNNLPTQEEYNEINNNYENILKEFKSSQNIIKTKDEEINNLKMRLESILAQNKNMKGVITKKENELEKMKSSLNSMKEELKAAKNKMNDEIINHKQTSRDYDMLNQKYKSTVSEKDKLSKECEEKKVENFNLQKENIQLKKLIEKLKEDIKLISSIKKDSNKKNNENINQIEYKIYESKNENQDLVHKNMDKNIKNLFQAKIKNFNNTIENKKIINKNNKQNNKNKKLDETEEIIYNNDDEEDSDEEDNSSKEVFNNLKNKIYLKSIKRNLQNEILTPKEKKPNLINKDFKTNEKEKNKEYIALIKYKDKIIGCNREKIKSLIKGKEYQIIEKEINALIKEKEKIEGDLLKMPERPRKLNDIKNKKEINDAINKIENDINFIRNLLKNTDDYYIN